MSRIHVAFQEGFRNDEVVLRIGGKEIDRKLGVTTRLQIGLAVAFDLEVPDERFELEVEFPARRTSEKLQLDPSGPKYVGISLSPHGEPTHVVSAEPFGYL